jgi:hypothetical protein
MRTNFYQKLFFIYYCAAKKYNDDSTAIFYSSVLLGGLAMFTSFIVTDIFVIFSTSFREFIKSHYDIQLYIGLCLTAIIAISNLIYFKSGGRYKKLVHHYRIDLNYKTGLFVYLKYASIPTGLWALMTLLAFYVRSQKWFY